MPGFAFNTSIRRRADPYARVVISVKVSPSTTR
jgi:hypothetical protein